MKIQPVTELNEALPKVTLPIDPLFSPMRMSPVHADHPVAVDIDLARGTVGADVEVVRAELGSRHVELRVVMHIEDARSAGIRLAKRHEARGIELRRVVEREDPVVLERVPLLVQPQPISAPVLALLALTTEVPFMV